MDPTRRPDHGSSDSAEPRAIVAGLWGTALFLSLLFSSEVSAWVLHDAWLSKQGWAVTTARTLDGIAAFTGLRSANQAIARMVAWTGERLLPPIAPVALTAERVAAPGMLRDLPPVRGSDQRTPPLRAPGAARHRILLIGESSIQFYLGSELERVLRSSYRNVEVKRFGKLATSLVRSDVLDWYAKASALLDEFQPDIVIANFGGNDAQNIVGERGAILKFGTPAWDAEFASRVSGLTQLVRARGARLVMIGMPAMRDAGFSRRMKRVNDIIRREMERWDETYVSSWELTVDANGEYRKAVTLDGTTGLMRLSDGKHYSKLGGRFVALRTLERLERRFVLPPRDPALSIAVPRKWKSRALQRQVSYLAYVPQQAGEGGTRLPVLFLLHRNGGSYEEWAEHAHRDLQRLSSAHDLVIVTPEGGSSGWYLDSPLVPESQYESHLLKEIVPDIERTLPASQARAVAGISAGGNGAIALALKHPGFFKSASSIDGILDLSRAADRHTLVEKLGPYTSKKHLWHGHSARHLAARRPEVTRRLPMLITVGASDEWAPVNRAFHAELDALGISHVYEEKDGRHEWSYWAEQLARHVAWHAQKLRVR